MKLQTRFFMFAVAVLMLSITTLYSTASNNPQSEYEVLVKKTIESLEDGKFLTYKKLRPTISEITTLFEKAITDPKIKKRMIANYKRKERYSLRRDRNYFYYAVRMCKDVKIDWKEAEIYSITPSQVKETKYFQKADLHFMLLSKKRLFRFKLDDCVKIAGRWVITDGIRWQGMTIKKK